MALVFTFRDFAYEMELKDGNEDFGIVPVIKFRLVDNYKPEVQVVITDERTYEKKYDINDVQELIINNNYKIVKNGKYNFPELARCSRDYFAKQMKDYPPMDDNEY